MKLETYASVRTGLVFSRKEAPPWKSKITYRALSLKNVPEDGKILLCDIEDFFAGEVLKKEYFTCEGDVLLRLSAPYSAVLITEREVDLLIPAHFAIIRTYDSLDPRYLCWWLTKNKKRFYQIASGGTMMGTISSGYIANMPFTPPPIEKQRQVARLLELSNREQQLLSALAKKKKLLVDAILNKIPDMTEK